MAKTTEIFLDIETDYSRNITVIGFRAAETGLVQLVGDDATARRLKSVLPKGGRLFTYNGHCFDLAVIRGQLGFDLRAIFDSFDLRWICQGAGLRGGQKAVEQHFGWERKLVGMSGLDAIALWRRHQHGNTEALGTLLRYNAEDVDGIAHIRKHLRKQGLLNV